MCFKKAMKGERAWFTKVIVSANLSMLGKLI